MRPYLYGMVLGLTCVVSSYFLLFYTTTGSKLVLHCFPSFLPVKINYKHLEGNLHSGLRLRDVHFSLREKVWKLDEISLKLSLHPSHNPLHWQSEFVTGKQSLTEFFPDISGDIDMVIFAKGKISLGLHHAAMVRIASCSGHVYQQPLMAEGSLSLAPDGTLILQALRFQSGKNMIRMNGTLAETSQITWDVQLPLLSQLDHTLAGSVHGQGVLQGSLDQPKLIGDLHIRDLHQGMLAVRALGIHTTIDKHSIDVNATAEEARYGDYVLPRIVLKGQLERTKQYLEVACTWPSAAFTFNLSGKTLGNRWQAAIDVASVKPVVVSSQVSVNAKLDPSYTFQEWKTYPLDIEVVASLDSLQLFQPWLAKMGRLQGSLKTHWRLTGNLLKPSYQGKTTVAIPEWHLPQTGTSLRQIELEIESQGRDLLMYRSRANAGKGSVTLEGSSRFDQVPTVTDLHLRGEHAELIKTDIASIVMDPAIDIRIQGPDIHVKGEVFVPFAQITPNDYSSTVVLSDDVIFADDTEEMGSTWSLTSDITLRLGKHVLLNYMGLRASLGGVIALHDDKAQATTASGQLFVRDGRFDAYGRSLTIRTGQLLFTGGPVTNPGLNIQAVKKVGVVSPASNLAAGESSYIAMDTLVGVSVVGTLQKPQLSLFSEPGGISQSQILSYLVLGKAIDEFDDEKNQLLEALKQDDSVPGQRKMLTEQLQAALRLDELSVQSSDVYDVKQQSIIKNTSLTLGKLLSPKLLLSYSVGITEPINILKMTYRINKKWLLRSQTDLDSSSVDLLYSIEKD